MSLVNWYDSCYYVGSDENLDKNNNNNNTLVLYFAAAKYKHLHNETNKSTASCQIMLLCEL